MMSSYLKLWFYLVALSTVSSFVGGSRLLEIRREVDHNNDKVAKGDKVLLQVYYEVWCGGCRVFHTNTLDKVLKEIGAYIDLKSYPYGNTLMYKKDGKITFDCQHGPAECYGNKLHACAIDILKNVTKSEFYNSCMMQLKWGPRGSTDVEATKCGESMNIDSKPIMECAKSQKGDDLLEYYGEETKKVTGRNYVPYVLLNGNVFDIPNSDLKEEVCKALSNPPAACNNL